MVNYAFINAQNFVVEIIESIDPTETQTDIDGTIVGGSVEACLMYSPTNWRTSTTCHKMDKRHTQGSVPNGALFPSKPLE